MPLHAQLNVTPDGFCNAEDVVADDDFMNFATDLIDGADRIVLGRRTYELFVVHWPAAARDSTLSLAEQRLGRAIDETPRTVVSRSMTGSAWARTVVLSDLTAESARELAQGGTALILGSPSIITQVAEWGLLDRLHLTAHPVMGGDGVRPFDRPPASLTAAGRSELPSGVTDFRFEHA